MVAICAAFVMAHLRGIPTSAWTSGVGMGDLGILLGDLAISACGFAIIGMIAGVLLRSSVIAIAAGLAVLLPVETILTDAIPGTARWLPAQLLESIAQGGSTVAPFSAALITVSAYLLGAVADRDARVRAPGRDCLRVARAERVDLVRAIGVRRPASRLPGIA